MILAKSRSQAASQKHPQSQEAVEDAAFDKAAATDPFSQMTLDPFIQAEHTGHEPEGKVAEHPAFDKVAATDPFSQFTLDPYIKATAAAPDQNAEDVALPSKLAFERGA